MSRRVRVAALAAAAVVTAAAPAAARALVAPAAPAASAGVDAKAGCRGAAARAAHASMRRVRAALACLIRAERAARGLPSLRRSRRLNRAARRHSADMVRRHYFAHVSPGGRTISDRVRAAGYGRRARSWSAAENIGAAEGAAATARTIVQAWVASPPHRAALLSRRYRDMGLGLRASSPGGRRGLTVTLVLGARG